MDVRQSISKRQGLKRRASAALDFDLGPLLLVQFGAYHLTGNDDFHTAILLAPSRCAVICNGVLIRGLRVSRSHVEQFVLRCVGSGAEGNPDKAWIPDALWCSLLQRDIRLDHTILEVGFRQQRETFVVLPLTMIRTDLRPR